MTDSWSTFMAWMDMKLSRWNNQSKRRRTQLENKKFIQMSGETTTMIPEVCFGNKHPVTKFKIK